MNTLNVIPLRESDVGSFGTILKAFIMVFVFKIRLGTSFNFSQKKLFFLTLSLEKIVAYLRKLLGSTIGSELQVYIYIKYVIHILYM